MKASFRVKYYDEQTARARSHPFQTAGIHPLIIRNVSSSSMRRIIHVGLGFQTATSCVFFYSQSSSASSQGS